MVATANHSELAATGVRTGRVKAAPAGRHDWGAMPAIRSKRVKAGMWTATKARGTSGKRGTGGKRGLD